MGRVRDYGDGNDRDKECQDTVDEHEELRVGEALDGSTVLATVRFRHDSLLQHTPDNVGYLHHKHMNSAEEHN